MMRLSVKTPCGRALRLYTTAAKQRHDIVIIGGGPAGLTLATALKNSNATKNLSVALIEGGSLDKIRQWDLPEDKWENRVSSLTPRSVGFLKKIGAWDCIKRDRVKEYDEMKVWDGCSDARIEFDPSMLGENADIAYMSENVNLQQSLLKRLDEINDGNTHLHDQVKVKSITHGTESHGNWPVVELEDGKKLEARLLIGADGANSPVRHFAGIQSRGWDYNRHGVVATVKLEWEDFRSVAWQRFLKTGPLALLPLPNGYASMVWSTTPERAAHLKKISPADFCALVNAGFRLGPVDLEYLHSIDEGIVDEVNWRLENTHIEDEDNSVPIPILEVQEGTRMNFPLKMKHADTYVAERVALVGDAAHSTHPLAGQGLNMGQTDVANLVDALEKASLRGMDIGSLLALEPFWAKSYVGNHTKLGVVDKLHKLYSTDFEPIVQLRSLGLNTVNSLPWLKAFLMKNASN